MDVFRLGYSERGRRNRLFARQKVQHVFSSGDAGYLDFSLHGGGRRERQV